MLGHKWEQAQGTIADVQIVPETRHHPRVFRYLVDVRMPSGEVIRGTVEEKDAARRAVGSAFGVEVNAKTGELRADPSQPRPDMISSMMNLTSQPMPGASGFAGPSASVHVVVPGGQDIGVEMGGEEIQGLVRAMMSGDPAAKQAARERIMQIRAHAQERAAEQQAGTGPGPGTGTGTDAGTASAPAADPFAAFDHPGGFGDPGGFGQGSGYSSAPGFQPFSAPAAPTFGSFDTGTGQGTPQERIARLQQLLDKGILTESEFREQRLRIINEI